MTAVRACVIIVGALWLAVPVALAQTFGSRSHFTEQGGAAVYAAVCASCHMRDGRGATGAATYPALVQDPRLASIDYPILTVLLGQKAMPGFARTLSDQQIADVITYLRTHCGNAYPDATTPAEVAAAGP
jgi:mono/diheme cytochrome c family protein